MVAWKILMRDLNVNLSWNSVLKGYLLSFLPRYIPGSIWGYLSRNEWLYQEYHVDYFISNIGSILELGTAILANSMIVFLYFFYSRIPIWLFFILAPIFTVLFWRLFKAAVLLKKNKSNMFWKMILKISEVKTITLSLSTFLFLTTWMLYGIGLFLIQSSFEPLDSLNLERITGFTGIYSLAWMVGFFIIFIPAGLGFRELALTNLLVTSQGFGNATANATAIISRISVMVAEIGWLILGFILLGISSRRIKGQPQQE
jgi:hypothetical protein